MHVTVPNELRNYFWSVELWTGTEPDGVCLARRGDVIISSQSMRSGEPQKRGTTTFSKLDVKNIKLEADVDPLYPFASPT